MSIAIGIIKVVFLLGFLVFIHEGGHFLVAKLLGVKVKEFSIGFGPSLFFKKGNYTKYSVRAIPLGGYVDMLGETENIDEEGSFSSASVSKRFAIVIAGALVNIIFGVIIYFILMSVSGVNSTTIVKNLVDEYHTQDSVMQEEDQILMINGEKTRIKSDIDKILSKSDGSNLKITILRNCEIIDLDVSPKEIQVGDIKRYILGVEVQQAEKNIKNNIYYGFWETVSFLDATISAFAQLFTGNANLVQMTGPVGISGMIVKTSGVYDFIYLLAVISISLGITNLLPIPALDGGKIILLLIEGIRKKKIKQEVELQIQSIGFTFLILLSLYVSFNDIIRLF